MKYGTVDVISWVALRVIGAALIVTVLIAALWVHDVWDDHKHDLQVNSETPVFAGSGGDECDEAKRLTVVQQGATLHVRRIRY
jgi:hypothetical protein